MIVGGSKSTHVGAALLEQRCPTCGKERTVTMDIHQHYWHVLMVPFFPVGKTGRSQCSYCKDTLHNRQMPSSLKTAYNKVKQPIRAPAWTYTGIILALGIIATGFISDQRETVRTASRVVAPEAGDVLAVKRGGGTYTLYKVQNTTADSAYLLMNQFETDQESGLNVIKGKGPSAYLPAPVGFSRKDLKIWLDQGLIVGVER